MSSQEPARQPSTTKPTSPALGELAALDNFVRLQQSQTEYLAWLELNEKKAGLDGYIYRQIR